MIITAAVAVAAVIILFFISLKYRELRTVHLALKEKYLPITSVEVEIEKLKADLLKLTEERNPWLGWTPSRINYRQHKATT